MTEKLTPDKPAEKKHRYAAAGPDRIPVKRMRFVHDRMQDFGSVHQVAGLNCDPEFKTSGRSHVAFYVPSLGAFEVNCGLHGKPEVDVGPAMIPREQVLQWTRAA